MTTRFTDDFSSGSWATNWTSTLTGTSNILDVVTGEGRMQVPNGSSRAVTVFDNKTATSNQELLVKIRDDNFSRNNQYLLGVAMVPTAGRFGSASSGVYILISGAAAGTVSLYHAHASVHTAGNTGTSIANSTATRWHRLRHLNGVVYYKNWIDGSAEPATWDITQDISSFGALPAGSTGLAIETLTSTTALENYYFDNIESTDGSTTTPVTYNATPMTSTALSVQPVVGTGRTISAQAMTATSLAVQPGVGMGKTISATPLTASALVVDPAIVTNFQRGTTAEDASVFDDAPDTVFNGDSARIQKDVNGDDWLLFKVTSPLPTETVNNLVVKFVAKNPTGFTPELYRITSNWSETSVTYNTMPSMVYDSDLPGASINAGSMWTLNLIDAFNRGYTYGFAVRAKIQGGQGVFYTKDAIDPANRPVVEWTYTLGRVNKTFTAPVATASGLMSDPVTTTTTGVSQSATAMTVTASLTDPTITADKFISVNVSAAPATATGSMPANSGWSDPRTVAAEAATGSAVIVQPTAATTKNVNWLQRSMTGTANIQYSNIFVNDAVLGVTETDDAYFNRVIKQGVRNWWRMNDKTTVVKDRSGAKPGTYNSVQFGRLDAPQNRGSAYFDGTGFINEDVPFDQTGVSYLDNYSLKNGLEFSFRTTKVDGYLLYSRDSSFTVQPGVTINDGRESPGMELYLVDGKLHLKVYRYERNYTGPGLTPVVVDREVQGRINVADGQWHTIHVRPFTGPAGEGTEFWVDGQFDVRRYGMPGFLGMPDYVGGRPGLPISSYFVGDFSEISYRDKIISDTDIQRNFYAFMGWAPIEVGSFTGTADIVQPRARGNQKKALYLYWNTEPNNFDPMPQFVWPSRIETPFVQEAVGDYVGFKVFSRPIVSGPFNNYTNYRDEWTDEPRLIDLEKDIDLTDFDVIMFHDWPDESSELDFEATVFGRPALERLVQQCLDANDAGMGLLITNPRQAVDFGIVDRVEFCSSLRETSNIFIQRPGAGVPMFSNLYDYKSALDFPWDIAGTDGLFVNGSLSAIGTGKPENLDPNFIASKATSYYDTNKNNRFRVKALIDNLTTVPSYMIDEVVFHRDFDTFGNEGFAYKYLHRMSGLNIGDEYVFNGSAIEPSVDKGLSDGYWATPPGHVVAGTVVTTFGSKHWIGSTEVANPYADYATTIVVQPGDRLGSGRIAQGKIYCNFTETPSRGLGVEVQVLPGSPEDIEMKKAQNTTVSTIEPPLFVPQGTQLENEFFQKVINHINFPLDRLKDLVQKRYGKRQVQVVFQDIGLGTSNQEAAQWDNANGIFIVDKPWVDSLIDRGYTDADIISGDYTRPASTVANGIVYYIGIMIDYLYLQPYQRVAIWNVFHSDLNFAHGPLGNWTGWTLPPDFVINADDKDIKAPSNFNNEGWQKSVGAPDTWDQRRVGWAWGNVFVKAYSDITLMDSHQYDPHPATPVLVAEIKKQIEQGSGAWMFDNTISTWPLGYPEETAAQKEWEYSWTRSTVSSVTESQKDKVVSILLPNGQTQAVTTSGYGGMTSGRRDNVALTMIRTTELFPTVGKPRWEMDGRAMFWLSFEENIALGDKVIRAQTMTGTAEAEPATGVGQHDVTINAEPMRAVATEQRVAEDKEGSVTVLAFPMEARGTFTGVGATINAAPMTASADMGQTTLAHAAGTEMVVLTLHGYDATLFIKEEA